MNARKQTGNAKALRNSLPKKISIKPVTTNNKEKPEEK
jgi:hypothetical protein